MRQLICLIALLQPAHGWSLIKEFDLRSMHAIERDWNIINWAPRTVNNEMQQYLSDGRTITANGDGVHLNAYRHGGGGYRSGRLESKQRFTPLDVDGRKLRVEFNAKVPTYMGAWPALWMLGEYGTGYGEWPQVGEIDVMEWVHQTNEGMKGALHWKGSNDWDTSFWLGRNNMRDNWYTYGVEYSAAADSYIQFYVTGSDGVTTWGPKVHPPSWSGSWHGSGRSVLAPFDNRMTLIMNVAVGGDWGGCCGVSNYDAFNGNGVTMHVRSVKVFGEGGTGSGGNAPPSGGQSSNCENGGRGFIHYEERNNMSEQDCRSWCQNDGRCKSATYNRNDRVCFKHEGGYELKHSQGAQWVICYFR